MAFNIHESTDDRIDFCSNRPQLGPVHHHQRLTEIHERRFALFDQEKRFIHSAAICCDVALCPLYRRIERFLNQTQNIGHNKLTQTFHIDR